MRYLRMLTNAVLAGALAAMYVAILFLQLNPHLPLDPVQLWPLLAVVVGFYTVHLAAAFYALIVARQLLSRDLLSPGWLSLRLLSWLSAAAAGGAAIVMWLNLSGLRTALADDAAQRLAFGAAGMSLCALALFAIAAVHYSFGRRGSFVGASLFVLAVIASLTLPVAARGTAVARPLGSYPIDVGSWPVPASGTSRVIVLSLDGASLDYISLSTAEGRMPNFGRVLDAGAAMHLATLRPTQPGPVWTAVATGKYPPKHGVLSASNYTFGGNAEPLELLPDHCFAQALVFLGFLREVPGSSASLRARPLWSILSSQGVPVGIVGWPLTHPVQPVLGFLVSDRFHLMAHPLIDPDASDAAFPPEVVSVGASVMAASEVPRQASAFLGDEARIATPSDAPIWRDRIYRDVTNLLRERFADVRLLTVRYRGLDVAGHSFWASRSATVGASREADPAEQRLNDFYHQVDEEVGVVLDTLEPDDLLLVVSGFGMEAVSLPKRLLARLLGDPDLTGSHENAPDGFLLAYGSRVEPGRRLRGSVVDVAPTILYYLGVPVPRDVDGLARTDIFTDEFTASHPIAFASYEG